jgi:hypothetical protein
MNDFMADRSKLAADKHSVETLNNHVQNLTRNYKDMCTVYEKINDMLDSSRVKLTASERSRGMKLLQQIEAHKQTMAFSLSEIKGN